jgi:hypothetical protein
MEKKFLTLKFPSEPFFQRVFLLFGTVSFQKKLIFSMFIIKASLKIDRKCIFVEQFHSLTWPSYKEIFDFGFFTNQFPPGLWVSYLGSFEFLDNSRRYLQHCVYRRCHWHHLFRTFIDSMTLAINLSPITTTLEMTRVRLPLSTS